MSNIPTLAGLIKPRNIKASTTYDVILKAWLEHRIEELPQDQQNMLTRWRKANALMREGSLVKKGEKEITMPYTFDKLVDYLVEEFKISTRTAYDDIKHAKKFFTTDYTKDDINFARGVMIEWGQQFMFEARAAGDHKSASAYYKALMEIQQVNVAQQDMPDYENINLPSFNLVVDPSLLGFPAVENPEEAVKRILAKRKKNKIDLIISESETVDFTEGDGN